MGINYVTRPENSNNKLNVILCNKIFEHGIHTKYAKQSLCVFTINCVIGI